MERARLDSSPECCDVGCWCEAAASAVGVTEVPTDPIDDVAG